MHTYIYTYPSLYALLILFKPAAAAAATPSSVGPLDRVLQVVYVSVFLSVSVSLHADDLLGTKYVYYNCYLLLLLLYSGTRNAGSDALARGGGAQQRDRNEHRPSLCHARLSLEHVML